MVQMAKVFKNGASQAVRLPKDFRLGAKEVYIERHGDLVVLTPKGARDSSRRAAPGRPRRTRAAAGRDTR